MSVQDLKDTLAKIESQADAFSGQLGKFLDTNEDDLSVALKALHGTSSGTDAAVASALREAAQSIEDAKRAMSDAARAAHDYAARI